MERLDLPKPTSPFEALFGPIDPSATRLQSPGSALLKHLPEEVASQLRGLGIYELLAKERVLTVLPYRVLVK